MQPPTKPSLSSQSQALLPEERTISNHYKLCGVTIIASAILITIGSLALAGMLLPSSPLGNFLIHGLGQKGILGLAASFGPSGIILLGCCLKALYKIRENEKVIMNNKVLEHNTRQLKINREFGKSTANQALPSQDPYLISETAYATAPLQDNFGILDTSFLNTLSYDSVAYGANIKYATSDLGYSTSLSYITDQTYITITASVFGVYEGIDSLDMLEKVKNQMISKLSEYRPHAKELSAETIQKSIKDVYSDFNKQAKELPKSGVTAATAIIIGTHLFIANLGSSRAILANQNQVLFSTTDVGDFVFSSIYPKAAIGFFGIKNDLIQETVNHEPEILHCDLSTFSDKENPKDNYLIIGSRGFWHTTSEQEVLNQITAKKAESKSLKTIADEAVQKAKTKTNEEIVLVIVDLSPHNQARA